MLLESVEKSMKTSNIRIWLTKHIKTIKVFTLFALLSIAMGMAFLFFYSSAVTTNISYSLYDYFLNKKSNSFPKHNDIVLVTIDDLSIKESGMAWPWPRSYHAGLINALTRAGVKTIAYDISFSEPSSNDAVLKNAIINNGSVVFPLQSKYTLNDEYPFYDVALFGHVEVPVDNDGVTRYVKLFNQKTPSFALTILNHINAKERLDYGNRLKSNLNSKNYFAPFIYPPKGSYPEYTFFDVLSGKIEPAKLKDKIVFVGVTATGIGDRIRSSSLDNNLFISGLELQADIFDALRSDQLTYMVPESASAIINILSILIIALVACLAAPLTTIIVLLIYVGILFLLSFIVFYYTGYWYSSAYVSLAMTVVIFLFSTIGIHIRLKNANRSLNLNVADRTRKLVISNLRLAQEIQEKQEAESTLRESEIRLRLLLDGIKIGIVTIDAEGHIITANKTALLFFNLSLSDIKSHKIDTFFKRDAAHGGEFIITKDITERLQNINNVAEVECILVSSYEKSGIPVALLFSRLNSRRGEVNFSCIIRDISDQKRSEIITQEFVATVSHELRTPLTSIRGSLGLINSGVSGEIPEKAQHLLSVALRNSDRLLNLVNDILDIQKIQLGTLDFHLKVIDIVDIVKQSIEVNEAYAQSYQVKIISNLPQYPIYILGDSDRLIQVMSNLLSNASKFSPSGGEIDVKVSLEGNKVLVSVQDQGVGIPDSFKPKVFQKFSQADDAKHRSKGTGLGLSITKALIERMSGTINFSSEEGKGTLFYFYLPLVPMNKLNEFISEQRANKDIYL